MRLALRRALPYALAVLALLLARHGRLAETVNLVLYDLAVQLRPHPSAAALPIRLITIEEEDLRQLGWPLPDRVLAEAVARMERAGVVAIGLVLYRDLGVGSGQEALRRQAAAPGPLLSVYSQIDGIGPIPGTPPQRQAYNDLLTDADGVVRRDLVHVRGQGAAGVALPLRLLEHGRQQVISPLRQRMETAPGGLERLGADSGGYSGLDDAGFQTMLSFHRPGSFQSWSLRSLLAGRVQPERLRGTMVLVGSRAPSLRDGFPVPFGRLPWAQTARRMPAIELHAHRLAALLARERGWRAGLAAAPGWFNGLVLAIAVALGVGLGEGIASLRRSFQAVALVAGLGLAAGGVALFIGGLWLNLALPLVGLIATATAAWTGRGMEQQQQRQQWQGLLGQTISASVARELWSQREELLAGDRCRAQERFVTLLIADIEHFTAIAEELAPDPLLRWLNQAMERLVVPIQSQGGLVNKFTGDGVLAVFGAPLSLGVEADAAAALAAARGICDEIQTLNAVLAATGEPRVRLRLGLHSGQVLVGSIGSRERWEYGVIGDAVNCASRIDTLPGLRDAESPPEPRSDCRILLSGATRALVAERAPADLSWRCWGVHALSGRSRREEIWELIRA
ncbi:MAG: CHASE2 domain-containing protein [Cyanobacteriota bacterium]|nr:CHASE2 domain-containing protein [Cyanobacteriota bacterium]